MPVLEESDSALERAFAEVVEELPRVVVDDAEAWHLRGPLPAFGEPVRWAVPGLWDAPPASAVPVVGPLVAQLEADVAALETLDPSTLPDGQVLGDTERLLELQQRLRVLQLAWLAEVERRRLYKDAGFHGMKGWLRHTAPDVDDRDRTLAERLRGRPHLAEAVREGRVSVTGARLVGETLAKVDRFLDPHDGLLDGQPAEPVVAQVVRNVIDLVARGKGGLSDDHPLLAALVQVTAAINETGGSQRSRVEQACVLLATHLPAETLKRALEEQSGALLPDLLEKQQEAAEERRGASLSRRRDGSWDLEARLTPECGERLHTALAAEARRDPANPDDTRARAEERERQAEVEGRDPFGEPTPMPPWEPSGFGEATDAPLVPRTRSRRLHDALDRMLERYLAEGLGGKHDKVPVQLTVVVPSALPDGTPGALPARSSTGALLARSVVRRWWCDAHVTALVVSRGWMPLGIAHTGRTLRSLERRASLVQQDHRCAGVDCCAGTPDPLIALVPHHLYDHSTHGRTSIGETVWLCPTGHHDVHTGKRRLRLRDGRLIDENGEIDDG